MEVESFSRRKKQLEKCSKVARTFLDQDKQVIKTSIAAVALGKPGWLKQRSINPAAIASDEAGNIHCIGGTICKSHI